MIQRSAIQRLEQWRVSADRKPLIIRGARQVGKTTLVDQFSAQFDNYLYVNLDFESARNLFDEEDIVTLVDRLHIYCRKKKSEGDTLLFIDEIQNSPKAVKSLRYFKEKMPQLFVIAAGSLLESLIDTHISFPVGRVEYMALRPCSFVEFLNGIGEEYDAEIVKSLSADAVHSRMMTHFLNYMVVGGMPEAIMKYAEKRDVLSVDNVYNSFLNAYNDDVQKYAKNKTMAMVISHILRNGWAYAAERISFNNFANSNYRSREVAEAMRTIERALIIELAYPVTVPKVPLIPNFNRKPKLLWIDTGLANYCSGVRMDIFNVDDIMSVWKGRMVEHIVAQELVAKKFEYGVRRNYWVRDANGASSEVDFIYQYDNKVIPIEVKSGTNAKLRSLHQFMELAPHDIAVRVWPGMFSVDNLATPSGRPFRLVNLPLYYVGQLDKVLRELL